MSDIFNIYCDESCHLQNDHQQVMVLGTVWCPLEKTKEIADKSRLRHQDFSQDHDAWYYKMYFDMLKVLLVPQAEYRIYLDIKDTRGADKIRDLHDVLCNNMYDFERKIIKRVQTIRSHEVEQLQLADLLIGIIGYANRGLETNQGKLALVERMRHRSGYNLTKSTLLREDKVNLYRKQTLCFETTSYYRRERGNILAYNQ